MKKHLAILLLAPSLFLASCDSDDDDKGPIEEVQDTAANLWENSDIVGSWSSDCAAFDALGNALDISAKQTLIFGGNNLTRSYVLYEDAACQTKVGDLQYEGNYELEKDAQDRGDYAGLNSTIKTVKVTPNSDFLVSAFNNITWCGVSNWSVDKTVEVTGTIGQGVCQIPVDINATTYGLVYAKGKTVYLAEPLAKTTLVKEERPVEVDKSVTFNKQ